MLPCQIEEANPNVEPKVGVPTKVMVLPAQEKKPENCAKT
jgi:hypothetical protein